MIERYAYNAYGETLEGQGLTEASAALTPWLFAGDGAYDRTSGLTNHIARWRSGDRFLTLDPFAGNMQDPQSLHKYLYAHANPVMNIDPTGMFSLAGISVTSMIKGSMRGLKLYGVNEVRQSARDAVISMAIGATIRHMIGADPFAGPELFKDAISGAVGGRSQRVLKAVSKVGSPALQFIIRFGKGPTLGILGVTSSHLAGTAAGQQPDWQRYKSEVFIGAMVGFAVDMVGQGVAGFSRGIAGGMFTQGESFSEGIARISSRIEQLRRQLPNNYQNRVLDIRMWKKVHEMADLHGDLRMAQATKFVLDSFESIENSTLLSSLDNITNKLVNYAVLDAE